MGKFEKAMECYKKSISLSPSAIAYSNLGVLHQQKGNDKAAVEFLKKHEAIWSKWVSADAAKKIKKAL